VFRFLGFRVLYELWCFGILFDFGVLAFRGVLYCYNMIFLDFGFGVVLNFVVLWFGWVLMFVVEVWCIDCFWNFGVVGVGVIPVSWCFDLCNRFLLKFNGFCGVLVVFRFLHFWGFCYFDVF